MVINHAPFFVIHAWLVPLLPFAAAAVLFFSRGRLKPEAVSGVAIGSLAISCLISIAALFQVLALHTGSRVVESSMAGWIPNVSTASSGPAGHFQGGFGILVDPFAAVMAVLVTGAALTAAIYSISVVEGLTDRISLGCTSLLIAASLGVILANNLVLLFAGWEALTVVACLLGGLTSVGHDPASLANEPKRFVLNLVSDAAVFAGVLCSAGAFGALRFTDFGSAATSRQNILILTMAASFLMAGAVGKAVHGAFLVWPADASRLAPPLSISIQAIAAGGAGVYLILRAHALFRATSVPIMRPAVIGGMVVILAASQARKIANAVRAVGSMCARIDAGLIDRITFEGTSRLTSGLARRAAWLDEWIVDGAFHATAQTIRFASPVARFTQTGEVQSYLVAAVAAIAGFLGVSLYLLVLGR